MGAGCAGFSRAAAISLIATASGIVACSGGGTTTYVYVTASPGASSSTSPTASPTATPTPPPAGVLSVNPTALSMNGTGASYAQDLDVQETSYTGAFTESDTCGAVATVTPTSGAGPSTTFTVTPSAGGTCNATFSDTNNQHVSVAITVTTTGFTVQTR